MSKNKARELVPLIIEAKTEEDAINVLNESLKLLHLTSDYVSLVYLKDKLEEFQAEYKEIVNNYREIPFPRPYESLAETRDNLSFLYVQIQDELSFEINKCKIYWGEDKKATVRAESMVDAKDNEDLVKANNGKVLSLSSLDRVYGISGEYQEYMNLYSISYGMYQSLLSLLSSIRIMTDSVASQSSHALMILTKDAK